MKGADQYLLSVMATATVVARLGFSIPLGRMADRLGRKRVIHLVTPLWYLSNIMLTFAQGPAMLVLYAVLQAFFTVMTRIVSTMTMEMVPVDQQGRWQGMLGLMLGLVTIPAPLIGGLVWRELGPKYVFLLPIALDLLLRVPLFCTVQDTLHGAGQRADAT